MRIEKGQIELDAPKVGTLFHVRQIFLVLHPGRRMAERQIQTGDATGSMGCQAGQRFGRRGQGKVLDAM